MATTDLKKLPELVRNARYHLRMAQPEFAERVGTSPRTLIRWENSQRWPRPDHLHAMARLVYPVHRTIAAQFASYGKQTLVGLGLEAAPLPQPAPSQPAPQPTRRHLVDSVLCAAAEVADLPPAKLRAALLAGLIRAEELGLGVAELRQGLGP